MDEFYKKRISFKRGVKIRELLGDGIMFDLDTADNEDDVDYSKEIDFSNFVGSEEYIIPVDRPFDELKSQMEQVIDGVWKKIYKGAHANSETVNFARHCVTYHRNLYMENEAHPFDSTWLNGKPDVINNNETHLFLEGILDALSTMKQGEQSYFIISYTKMYKENGCEPRVLPRADIFCDLKVLKLEEIGDQDSINKLKENTFQQSFDDAKTIYNDGRLRAKNLFENKKTDAAIKIYEKITQMLQFCKTNGDDEIRECKEIMIQNFTNLGTCYNLREEPQKTLYVLRQIEALCSIRNNSKILFMKGKALRMIGEYKQASVVLKQASHLAPNNSAICVEMQKLEECISKYNDMTKNFSAKLFISKDVLK